MYTTLSSCRIHYEVKGRGPAMVLLHGWGQNIEMMAFIQEYFQEKYMVVNIDLPGFGDSEEPTEAWGIYEYTNIVKALVDELHITKPILVAHSFGARIALRYSYLYPVEKMILTGAAGIKKRHGISYYARVYTYKLLKKIRPPKRMGSDDFQMASPIMKGVLVRSVEEDLRPFLKYITCETLLVWGEEDEATPLWMGKIMEQEMRNATLVVLEEDDHFAYFHQQQRFLRIMEYFL